MEKAIEKAKILVEALPYIKKFYGKTIVFKYGGSLMLDQEAAGRFATDIVLLKYVGIKPVLVHGGGKEISRWLERMGKQSVFSNGLRFTDPETMEITEMVLSGKINSELVALINSHGAPAVGVSGKDAELLQAERMERSEAQDLGLVGQVRRVNTAVLSTLTENGYIPVVSSVGVGADGETLNINADHAAAAVAGALKALKIIYLTDVEGVLKNGKLISSLATDEARALIQDETVKAGMLPKLKCALEAMEQGVRDVHIINGSLEHAILLELFTSHGIGTMLTRGSV